ncbi:MAG: hypothetical protein IKC63_00345 [Clostridia bacterium]|nr:hypothetical protein [Clostridia bacterium]
MEEIRLETVRCGVQMRYTVFRYGYGDRNSYSVTVREERGGRVFRCELPDIAETAAQACEIARFFQSKGVSAHAAYDEWARTFGRGYRCLDG